MDVNIPKQAQGGISSSTLKLIAIISMLTDHTAYVLLGSFLATEGIYDIYQFMRGVIGRWAFPIYCFLLVEGFERTRNRAKYAGRLFLFALLSEIPFDLAFYGDTFRWDAQNVFFTLLLGFMVMWGMYLSEQQIKNGWILWGTKIFLLLAACAVAEAISCDYGAKGIVAIVLLYVFRMNKTQQIMAGCIAFLWEYMALFAFIPIAFYKGKKGWNIKYVYYVFYPVHLLVLYGILQMIT